MGMSSAYVVSSPIGSLRAEFSDIGLRSLSLVKRSDVSDHPLMEGPGSDDRLSALRTYINDYFYCREAGRKDILMDMTGITAFRKRVYGELMKVPFGTVITYGDLATRAGYPGGARAVGNAMNSNPFLIVVPCHRVVASGRRGKNRLGGFGAGLEVKRFLLRLEGHDKGIIGL